MHKFFEDMPNMVKYVLKITEKYKQGRKQNVFIFKYN